MFLRHSLAAATALIGIALSVAPAGAVMQVTQMPDPNAPAQSDTAPDGLFNKSFSDHWQKPSSESDQKQGLGGFHFTVSGSNNSTFGGSPFGGSANGFTMSGSSSYGGSAGNPSAYENSKQPGSEFYQPLPGSAYPDYNFGH